MFVRLHLNTCTSFLVSFLVSSSKNERQIHLLFSPLLHLRRQLSLSLFDEQTKPNLNHLFSFLEIWNTNEFLYCVMTPKILS